MSYKILIINPGSTSTKIGVYEDETQLMEETLRHSTEEIAQYATIYDQKDFRKEVILKVLLYLSALIGTIIFPLSLFSLKRTVFPYVPSSAAIS